MTMGAFFTRLARESGKCTSTSSLDRPCFSVSLHPLEVLLEVILAFHVLHNVVQRNDRYDGNAKLLLDLLNGRKVAVLASLLSIDELENPDQLGLGVSSENGDSFPDSFLFKGEMTGCFSC